MSTTTPTDIKSLSLAELRELVAAKEQTEKDVLLTEIAALEKTLAKKRDELEILTGKPAPAKRGRKPKRFKLSGAAKPAKVKKGKAKRGAVGAAITTFVSNKGKSGAKVSEIAAALGFKPANITAFFYAKGNVKKFKKIAPATFALKK